jgi:hypothetical protein
MSDLVNELRHGPYVDMEDLCDRAADEITRLTARVKELEGALRELIDHTHNCEKELTEDLHHADFCGESLPLTKARAALTQPKGGE